MGDESPSTVARSSSCKQSPEQQPSSPQTLQGTPCKGAPPPSPELAVQSPPPWYAAAIGASGQHGDTLLPTAATAAAADMNLVSLWPVCSYACVLICHACVLILVCISYHGPIVASASLCVAHCPVDRISAVLVRSALTAALRFASWILQRKP